MVHDIYQSSLVVSHKVKKKQHAYAQPTRLLVYYLPAANAVKFPIAVTRSSWALPLSYYRTSTFLPCRMNEPKMNELGTTVVKNQPFRLLWHLFSYIRLKLDHLTSDSIVTRELIVLCRISKPTFITIRSTTFVMRPSILHPSMKKS